MKDCLSLCEDPLAVLETDKDFGGQWRRHLLFGGTAVVQLNAAGNLEGPEKSMIAIPNPPDGGVIAIAIRTGFGTLQVGFSFAAVFVCVCTSDPNLYRAQYRAALLGRYCMLQSG